MPTRSSARSQQGRGPQLNDSANENKENARLNGNKTKGRAKLKSSKVYCSCRKGDDGSPMILCAECNEWYVFIRFGFNALFSEHRCQVSFQLHCIERERCRRNW